MKKKNSGNMLITILVASALLSTLMVGTLQFFHSANRAQSNIEKAGQASDLEMTLRALVGNVSACTNTLAAFIPSATTNVESPIAMRDPNNAVLFREGSVYNGVRFHQLRGMVYPQNGGVRLVRIRANVEKVVSNTNRDVLGRGSYDYTYYANAEMTGATVNRCTLSDGQGRLSLVAAQPIAIPPTSSGAPRLVMAMTYPGPYPWGAAGGEVHMVNVPANCVNCPYLDTPPVAITAQGNTLGVALETFIELVSFDQTQGFAYGASVTAMLWHGGAVVQQVGMGAASTGSNLVGFQSSSFTNPMVMWPVTQHQTYDLRLRLSPALGPGGAPPSFSIDTSGAIGTIFHYIDTP